MLLARIQCKYIHFTYFIYAVYISVRVHGFRCCCCYRCLLRLLCFASSIFFFWLFLMHTERVRLCVYELNFYSCMRTLYASHRFSNSLAFRLLFFALQRKTLNCCECLGLSLRVRVHTKQKPHRARKK